MKKVSFLKALFFVLFIFSGTQVMAQAATALMGGHCSCSVCDCSKNSGNCMIAIIDAPLSEATYERPIEVSISSGTTIRVAYQDVADPEDQETLDIDYSVSLPQSLCTTLGVSSIVITPGVYTPDYTENPNGDMIFNAQIVE